MNLGKDMYRMGQNMLQYTPDLKRYLWRLWYNFIINFDQETELIFMNYGYSDIESDNEPLSLQPVEEKYRYRIQLYHHVAESIGLSGKEILEVGQDIRQR